MYLFYACTSNFISIFFSARPNLAIRRKANVVRDSSRYKVFQDEVDERSGEGLSEVVRHREGDGDENQQLNDRMLCKHGLTTTGTHSDVLREDYYDPVRSDHTKYVFNPFGSQHREQHLFIPVY